MPYEKSVSATKCGMGTRIEHGLISSQDLMESQQTISCPFKFLWKVWSAKTVCLAAASEPRSLPDQKETARSQQRWNSISPYRPPALRPMGGHVVKAISQRPSWPSSADTDILWKCDVAVGPARNRLEPAGMQITAQTRNSDGRQAAPETCFTVH